MAGREAMATQLAGFVTTDSALSASAAGQVVTITGPADATRFTVTATAVDGGSIDDQTATVITTVEPVEEVTGVTPTGSVTITSGSPNVAATGTVQFSGSDEFTVVSGISVGPLAELRATESGVAGNSKLAEDVDAQIQSGRENI